MFNPKWKYHCGQKCVSVFGVKVDNVKSVSVLCAMKMISEKDYPHEVEVQKCNCFCMFISS